MKRPYRWSPIGRARRDRKDRGASTPRPRQPFLIARYRHGSGTSGIAPSWGGNPQPPGCHYPGGPFGSYSLGTRGGRIKLRSSVTAPRGRGAPTSGPLLPMPLGREGCRRKRLTGGRVVTARGVFRRGLYPPGSGPDGEAGEAVGTPFQEAAPTSVSPSCLAYRCKPDRFSCSFRRPYRVRPRGL